MTDLRSLVIKNGTTQQISNADTLIVGTSVDAASGQTLTIGGTNATGITIGSALVTTNFPGAVTLTGDVTTVGGTTFQTDAIFEGDVTFGNAATDKVTFVAKVDSDILFTGDGVTPPAYNIQNVADPTNPQDVATKAYVDAASGAASLQTAYQNGNTITTALADGAVIVAGDQDFTFTSSGNFGIGTGAPTDKLEVVGGITQTTGAVSLTANAASSFTTTAGNLSLQGAVDLDLSAFSGEVVVNQTGAAVNFRVESDNDANMLVVNGTLDRVGVGTATPSAQLEVLRSQDASTDSMVRNTSAGISAEARMIAQNDLGKVGFISALSSGNLTSYASVAGANAAVIGGGNSSALLIINNGAAAPIHIIPDILASNPAVSILANGNVGINSVAPSATLTVVGGITQTTGAVSLSANAASTFSTSAGNLSLTAAAVMQLEGTSTTAKITGDDTFLLTPNSVQTGFGTSGALTFDFDPSLTPYKQVGPLTGDISLANASNPKAARSITVEIFGDTVSRNITSVPAGWTWLGGTAPTVVPANSTVILSLASFGSSNNDVVASWSYDGSVNVTQVTASAPLASSGGTTPNISLTGTVGVTNGGTGTATAFTAGSVVFAGPLGVYAQDNANLFWDDTNNRLGIGTATPSYSLVVKSGSNGFEFDASTQTIGTAFGTGGALALLAEGAASSTGPAIYMGGSTRADFQKNALSYSVSGTEYFRVDGDFAGHTLGNVGIGTSTTPNEKLTVNGKLSLAEGSAPSATAAFGKLWANSAADARPYWLDDTGQSFNLTLDRFNTLTSGGAITIDASPALPVFNSVTLNANATFSTTNLGNGRSASVRVVCDGTTRTLTWPAGWTWLGAGAPASLSANDVGYLSITAYGATDADVIAAWSYENQPVAVTGSGVDNQISVWSGTYTQDGSASFTFDGTTFAADSAVTFNDSGAAVDFRVEGDTDANLLFVDGSADFVGIGTASPSAKLTVSGGLTQSGGAVSLTANAASSLTTSAGALTLTGAAASTWSTSAGALTITSAAAATWSTAAGNLLLSGAANLELAAGAGSEVVVNQAGADVDFRVESDTNTHMLFVDAANERVGVGASTLTHTFNVGSGASSNFCVASGGRIHTYDGTSPTDGQILIGDTGLGNFAKATLTAGTGVSVTNGAGTITLAATGTVPLITTGLTAGDVCYASANNTGSAAIATAAATSRVLGFVSTVGASGTIKVTGIYTAANFITGLTGLAAGQPVYLSKTSGKLTNDVSAFTTGDVVAEIGIAVNVTSGTGGTGAADVLIQPKSIIVL